MRASSVTDGSDNHAVSTIVVLVAAIVASACNSEPPDGLARQGAYEITYCEGTSGNGITTGPDGNIWVTTGTNGGVARVASDCTGYQEFTDPNGAGVLTYYIAPGPDGNLWFTDMYGGAIGRATPAGEVTTFNLPADKVETLYEPYEIVAGRDGNMWFTLQAPSSYITTSAPGYVGRFSPGDPSGTMTFFEVSGNPMGIAIGSDGFVWFMQTPRHSDGRGGGVGRITYDGALTHFPFPADKPDGPTDTALTTSELAAGSDGNIWFVEEWLSDIGRLSPGDGTFTFFRDVPAPQWPDDFGSSGGGTAHISHIASARDGNLYAIEHNPKAPYLFYQISPDGRITGMGKSRDPSQSTGGLYMTNGPDGNLWFTEHGIGRMTIPGATVGNGM